jgi:HK97 family phage major capsid protein
VSALTIVRGELDRVNGEIRALNATAETEQRAALTDAEAATYTALRDERTALEERAAQLEDEERRAATLAAASVNLAGPTGTPAGDGVTRNESTYRKTSDPGQSFIRDFLAARNGEPAAQDRLRRNNAEVSDFWAKRAGVTTVAGAGGEFDPPAWYIDQWVKLPRAGRAFADVLNKKDLPGGVSSINIPTVSTGTTVAAQSSQNTAVSKTDPGTSSVAISISTIAGYNLLSQQSIDQSPINLDEVVLDDLTRAYAAVLDTAAITAVAGTTGIIAQTYTDASPTTLKVNQQISDALQKVYTQRFEAPQCIVMTPKRWALFLSYGDSQNRPLVVPVAGGQAVNAFGSSDVIAAQGFVGTLQGLPVFVDPNVPVNLGVGTNQDEIFVMKSDDVWLYESAPRLDTQVAPYSNQLSVLVRFWRYYGLGVRTPKSIALLTGTGMIPPAFGA